MIHRSTSTPSLRGLAQWVEVEFDLLKNVVSYYTANSRKDPLINQIKPVLYDGKTNLESGGTATGSDIKNQRITLN